MPLSWHATEKTRGPAARITGNAAGLGRRNVTTGSVARVLLQVRVGDQLVRRNRIEIPSREQRLASHDAALPRPEIRPGREEAEPHQNASAPPLHHPHTVIPGS